MPQNANLTPKQIVDKNGVLTTRHVRSDAPESSKKVALPTPKLASTKKPSYRAKQLNQITHKITQGGPPSSFMMTEDEVNEYRREYGKDYRYTQLAYLANDVEVYDVLSVSWNVDDVLFMLTQGVRSSDEAHEFMASRKHTPYVNAEWQELVNESLRRGIKSETFIDNMRSGGSTREQKNSIEVLELRDIIAVHDDMNQVIDGVEEGIIKVSDIKAVGATRLRGRLGPARDALRSLNEPDCKITTDDIKKVLDRIKEEGLNVAYEQWAVLSLLPKVGPEPLNKIKELITLCKLYRLPEADPIRVYAALVQQEAPSRKHLSPEDVRRLEGSGADPEKVGKLYAEGHSVDSIMGITQGMQPAVSEGWL